MFDGFGKDKYFWESSFQLAGSVNVSELFSREQHLNCKGRLVKIYHLETVFVLTEEHL